MQHLLSGALSNPWGTLRIVLDGPLHPGGTEATGDLLGRAEVGPGTRLLDVGCGAGEAVSLARDRGAHAVGLDPDPGDGVPDAIRGTSTRLPVRTGALDVVLAECALCLSENLPRALEEARRSLDAGGRLALSDVVVEGDLAGLPAPLAGPLCLAGDRRREHLLGSIEHAGFDVGDVRSHREDLLAMRDRVRERVDYERLLGAMGERGREMLDGIRELEAAVEDGRVGYVSLVATRTD